ncbi:MAG: hypothetical protein ACI8SJ_000906 [Shewanella sp.]|jgi:hypothetical protein
MHVTSSGRHGGCKEDKDEQSSLPGCGMESHDVGQAQPDALKLQYSPMAQTTKPQATKKEP